MLLANCVDFQVLSLVPQVTSVIEEYGKIRAAVEGRWQHNGILRVGAMETFAQACLPSYVRSIATRYPDLQLEFVVGTRAQLEQDVLERKLDVAFAINPTGDPKLTLVPVGIQPATWAAAPTFNLRSPLHPSQLREVLVITNPHPAPMWRQITDWFRQAGLEPWMICRCSSPTVVAQLVIAGLGVSFLPRRLVEGAIKTGAVCALESELVLEPSRLFAIYRFADGGSLIQAVIALGSRGMAEAKLLDPAAG